MLPTVVSVFRKLPLTTSAISLFAIYTTIRVAFRRLKKHRHISTEIDENDLINKLPSEIIVQILQWVDEPHQLLAAITTCKKWQAVCEQYVWNKKCEQLTEILFQVAPSYMKYTPPLSADLTKKIHFFIRREQFSAISSESFGLRKKVEKSLGRYFHDRPEALFKVLYDMVTQPHPYYIDNNRLKAQATTKFFSVVLSLLPFLDQLIFWAPSISPQLWNPSPWAIPTQIRMILSMFSMFAFDYVSTPWYSSMPWPRIVLVLLFHLVSIGAKGILVTIGWCLIAGLFCYKILRNYYDDKIVVVGGIFVIPAIPAIYYAPIHFVLGYGLFIWHSIAMGTTDNQDKRGLTSMRITLPLAIGTLLWAYIAAFLSRN